MSLQEFLENEQEILNAVTALLRKIQHREEKIGDINSRLRNSLEEMDSLLEKKSRMDDDGKMHQNFFTLCFFSPRGVPFNLFLAVCDKAHTVQLC